MRGGRCAGRCLQTEGWRLHRPDADDLRRRRPLRSDGIGRGADADHRGRHQRIEGISGHRVGVRRGGRLRRAAVRLSAGTGRAGQQNRPSGGGRLTGYGAGRRAGHPVRSGLFRRRTALGGHGVHRVGGDAGRRLRHAGGAGAVCLSVRGTAAGNRVRADVAGHACPRHPAVAAVRRGCGGRCGGGAGCGHRRSDPARDAASGAVRCPEPVCCGPAVQSGGGGHGAGAAGTAVRAGMAGTGRRRCCAGAGTGTVPCLPASGPPAERPQAGPDVCAGAEGGHLRGRSGAAAFRPAVRPPRRMALYGGPRGGAGAVPVSGTAGRYGGGLEPPDRRPL